MDKEKMIKFTKEYVYNELHNESSGHDWYHIARVTFMARTIAIEEHADEFICEMAALLHDIADEKLNESEEAGLQKVITWLNSIGTDASTIQRIISIISTMSFKGGGQPKMTSLEGQVVQDADRLDAIGAIGIARTFAYAGSKGELIYDPELKPRINMTKEEYRKGRSSAINHFYEKLLTLKEKMNTGYAKQLAEERHRLMEQYLDDFFNEWKTGNE
ncbi:HD domain-containing protein [Robertmurraya massiliosenegalensis]|uniref:HD domain-containing protein n=1 Tax=Robertmurraya massiliosenegalensis TaxID=1287657 RepID=UPI000303AB80